MVGPFFGVGGLLSGSTILSPGAYSVGAHSTKRNLLNGEAVSADSSWLSPRGVGLGPEFQWWNSYNVSNNGVRYYRSTISPEHKSSGGLYAWASSLAGSLRSVVNVVTSAFGVDISNKATSSFAHQPHGLVNGRTSLDNWYAIDQDDDYAQRVAFDLPISDEESDSERDKREATSSSNDKLAFVKGKSFSKIYDGKVTNLQLRLMGDARSGFAIHFNNDGSGVCAQFVVPEHYKQPAIGFDGEDKIWLAELFTDETKGMVFSIDVYDLEKAMLEGLGVASEVASVRNFVPDCFLDDIFHPMPDLGFVDSSVEYSIGEISSSGSAFYLAKYFDLKLTFAGQNKPVIMTLPFVLEADLGTLLTGVKAAQQNSIAFARVVLLSDTRGVYVSGELSSVGHGAIAQSPLHKLFNAASMLSPHFRKGEVLEFDANFSFEGSAIQLILATLSNVGGVEASICTSVLELLDNHRFVGSARWSALERPSADLEISMDFLSNKANIILFASADRGLTKVMAFNEDRAVIYGYSPVKDDDAFALGESHAFDCVERINFDNVGVIEPVSILDSSGINTILLHPACLDDHMAARNWRVRFSPIPYTEGCSIVIDTSADQISSRSTLLTTDKALTIMSSTHSTTEVSFPPSDAIPPSVSIPQHVTGGVATPVPSTAVLPERSTESTILRLSTDVPAASYEVSDARNRTKVLALSISGGVGTLLLLLICGGCCFFRWRKRVNVRGTERQLSELESCNIISFSDPAEPEHSALTMDQFSGEASYLFPSALSIEEDSSASTDMKQGCCCAFPCFKLQGVNIDEHEDHLLFSARGHRQ